jgi:hypothetical protein
MKDMGKIKFYADATKVGMPFVCVNEGGFHNAIFMLDTGSTGNILFGYVYEQAKEQLKEAEGDYTVTGIDGQPQKVLRVIGNVPFCGKSYDMSFLVRNDDDAGRLLFEEMRFPIVGIGTLLWQSMIGYWTLANKKSLYLKTLKLIMPRDRKK